MVAFVNFLINERERERWWWWFTLAFNYLCGLLGLLWR